MENEKREEQSERQWRECKTLTLKVRERRSSVRLR